MTNKPKTTGIRPVSIEELRRAAVVKGPYSSFAEALQTVEEAIDAGAEPQSFRCFLVGDQLSIQCEVDDD